MKRSGAIWLVVGVVAVAALLMYFVVLPQVRDGKTVETIAQKAEEAAKDVKQTVNDAAKQVEDVADGAEQLKAAALGKMERIGQAAKTATDELEAVLAKQSPTTEEIAAAKAKLATALKDISALELPAESDGSVKAAVTKLHEGAIAAAAALDKLPTDPAAAKTALADIRTNLLAALPQGGALLAGDSKPAVAAEDKAASAQTETKTDDKAADAASTAEKPADAAEKPAEAADAATPAFDILRVEKDGSTVIAGRAEPGAKVEIVSGNDVIASTSADMSGDFAAVLDDPLTAGDHSIVLKSTTKDGKSATSEEVATVSVPKDASGELLAMVTKPGEASKIITMPEDKTAEVAANKSVTPDATETAKAAAAAAADATNPAEVAVATPDLPSSSADIASTPPVVADDKAASAAPEQQMAAVEPSQAAAESTTVTPADAAKAVEKTPAGTPEVLVSAVEIEGDKIFIAGTTRPGATVRVYADDQIVADATADGGGRFVADGTIKLAIGNHTIRADVLSANGSKVEFRASVPFYRPEGDLAAVSSADASDKPEIEPIANGAFDKARNEAGKALVLLKDLYADGRTPTVEELAAARSSAEIALKSLASVHVAADTDPALVEMVAKAAADATKALEKLKTVPADVAAFKSALGDVETIVASAAKPGTDLAASDNAANKTTQETAALEQAKPADNQPVEKAGETVSSSDIQITAKVDRLTKSAESTANQDAATATAPADTTVDASSTASADSAKATSTEVATATDQPKVIEQAPLKPSEGSVIIRRGDTLWQISRRVYGRGVRYTTIYVANQAQIQNPDRILPGQVFTMPNKWLDNAEELHKQRMHHKQ